MGVFSYAPLQKKKYTQPQPPPPPPPWTARASNYFTALSSSSSDTDVRDSHLGDVTRHVLYTLGSLFIGEARRPARHLCSGRRPTPFEDTGPTFTAACFISSSPSSTCRSARDTSPCATVASRVSWVSNALAALGCRQRRGSDDRGRCPRPSYFLLLLLLRDGIEGRIESSVSCRR